MIKLKPIISEVDIGRNDYDEFHPLEFVGVNKDRDRLESKLKNAIKFKGYRFIKKPVLGRKDWTGAQYINLEMFLLDRPFMVGVLAYYNAYLDIAVDDRLEHIKCAQIDSSVVHKRFRGQGLGFIMYQFLMNEYPVIVSDTELQQGSLGVWRKFAKLNGTLCGINTDKYPNELFKIDASRIDSFYTPERLMFFVKNTKLPKELKTKKSMKLPDYD